MRLLRKGPRPLLLLGGIVLLLVLAPMAVVAATNHNFHGAAERQSAKWTANTATISGTSWHNVPGLGMNRCTVNEVSEAVTLTVSGGPVRFRGVIDGVPEAPMKPGVVRFVPSGQETASFTFVANTGPFEANDNHRFDVQWQSPTGAPVTLHAGAVNLVFKAGSQAC
jgi:hypothetical protein